MYYRSDVIEEIRVATVKIREYPATESVRNKMGGQRKRLAWMCKYRRWIHY